MKYIKSYESIKYNVGDFVLVDPIILQEYKNVVPNKWLPLDFTVGEIIDELNPNDFVIKYYTTFNSHNHKILRLATPEEIETFNIKKSLYNITTKYNL